MSKHYIVINLNKVESAEPRLARIREQVRWGNFGVLMLLLVSVNFQVWMISNGYYDIISQWTHAHKLPQDLTQNSHVDIPH